jgi:hypothetical protein
MDGFGAADRFSFTAVNSEQRTRHVLGISISIISSSPAQLQRITFLA